MNFMNNRFPINLPSRVNDFVIRLPDNVHRRALTGVMAVCVSHVDPNCGGYAGDSAPVPLLVQEKVVPAAASLRRTNYDQLLSAVVGEGRRRREKLFFAR